MKQPHRPEEAMAVALQRLQNAEVVSWRWPVIANSDPQRLYDPDTFDISRDDANHMSFGVGIYFCIGSPRARLELQSTIAELVRTQPELVLNGQAVRTPMYQFRGFKSLEIGLHGER